MIAKKKLKKISTLNSKAVNAVKKSKKTLVAKKASLPKKKLITKKVLLKKVLPKRIPLKKVSVKKPNKKNTLKKLVSKKAVLKKSLKKNVDKKTLKVVKKPIVKLIKKTIKPKIVKVPKVLKENKISVIKKDKTPKVEANKITEQKTVKIGIKARKQLVFVAPQPVVEVSNLPKTKVKSLLISQPKPDNDKNPFYDLSEKYNLSETFRQFIKIEGLPVKDFRNQRINILDHKAVILTSRLAVDNYFRMCNEMRVTVPESMKYFCINEATAYYLQKYIQYRKRKIFFGHQTIRDLVDVIKKNKEEKFLLPASDVHKEQICDFLDAIHIKYTKAIMYSTVSADLSDIKNLNEYDMLAFFTSAGINSLKQNFPNFKQGNTRIACFGLATAETLKQHGYRLDVYAPTPKNPSMSGAIDEYLKEANKR